MIKFIEKLPDHVVGIEVNGEVTKEEYDNLVAPKMKELANNKGEINYLVVLKTDVSAFTAGVWWDDFKMALKYFSKWEKIAIVSDQDWIKTITETFGFAFPGRPKGFKLSEYNVAVAWVAS